MDMRTHESLPSVRSHHAAGCSGFLSERGLQARRSAGPVRVRMAPGKRIHESANRSGAGKAFVGIAPAVVAVAAGRRCEGFSIRCAWPRSDQRASAALRTIACRSETGCCRRACHPTCTNRLRRVNVRRRQTGPGLLDLPRILGRIRRQLRVWTAPGEAPRRCPSLFLRPRAASNSSPVIEARSESTCATQLCSLRGGRLSASLSEAASTAAVSWTASSMRPSAAESADQSPRPLTRSSRISKARKDDNAAARERRAPSMSPSRSSALPSHQRNATPRLSPASRQIVSERFKCETAPGRSPASSAISPSCRSQSPSSSCCLMARARRGNRSGT